MIHSTAYKVQKRKSLSGRENVLMVARDRCCQHRHPVWKYMLFLGKCHLLLSVQGEREEKEEKEVGGSERSDANIPNQAEFGEIA